MKKHLLLLVFVLAVSVAQAQEMYSFMYRDSTGILYNSNSNSLQQRDGDHIQEFFLYEDIGNYESIPLGKMCYKISPATLGITDSLFVADTVRHITLLAREPQGEGNVRASFEYRGDCDSSFLRISRFPDNDLHANPGEDVLVPVCEGSVRVEDYGFLMDRWGDLVMTYFRERPDGSYDQCIARIGLDGTLKRQAILTENQMYDVSPLRVLKESPLQYYQWHEVDYYPNDNLAVYVIDSLFNKNMVILNKILRSEIIGIDSTVYEYLGIDYETNVVPAGGDNVLVAARYTYDTNFWPLSCDYGVAVAKYDLRTMQLKGYTVFNDYHWYGSIGRPMGLVKMGDGTVYFIYKEHGYPDESVIIVKMDTDLNVEWKRFCKTGNINMFTRFNPPVVYEGEDGEEKGIAWSGYAIKEGNYDKTGWVYFLLNHDGTVGLSEGGVEVRPYAFYPNPVQSELHLQYSPDVQPARIELYDLQGRLLQTRTQGLESIGLEGLAAGQYLMKVTLENGKEFTDKVVKE